MGSTGNTTINDDLIKKLKSENERLQADLENERKENAGLLDLFREIHKEFSDLRESHKRLSKVLDISDSAILFIDFNGEIQSCNKQTQLLFGYTSSTEITGKTIFELTSDQDINLAQAWFQQVIGSGEAISVEKFFKRKDNTTFPGKSTSCLIDKRLEQIVVVIDDLSNQKALEFSLQHQLDLLRKQYIFSSELNKAKSLAEIKNIICAQLLMHTKADVVWLSINQSGKYEKIYNAQLSGSEEVNVQVNQVSAENDFIELNRLAEDITKLNIYEKEQVVNLEFLKASCPQSQIILRITIHSEKKYIIGLNYSQQTRDIHDDYEFITEISQKLEPSINSLEIHEQLKENEAKFRSFTEGLSDVIAVRNKEGKYTYISPSVKQYGFDPADILGKSAIDFVHKNDLPIIQERVAHILGKHGASVEIPCLRISLKYGKTGYAHVILTNLLEQKGVEGIVINIHNITDQVLFERKIKESEENYRTIFNNAQDAIMILDGPTISFCNNKTTELFHCHPVEIIGKEISTFFAEKQANGQDSMEISEEIRASLENKKSISFEWLHKDLLGKEIETHVSLNHVVYSGRECIMAVVRDISELKTAHKNIQENELKLRTIFESMKDGVFLCTDDFSINYMNNAMKTQLQRKNNLLGKCFNSVFGFKEPCEWCNKINRSGEKTITEIVYNNQTGQHFQISRSEIMMDGKPATLHISRDITEIKKAQELIEQSEEKFRNIFNYSNDAIFITDTEGKFLELNDIAVSRSGYSREAFLEMNISDLTDFSENNKIDDYIFELKKKGSSTCEIFYVSTYGKEINTEMNGRLIDYQGKKALLHVSRDITARKKVERRIMETIIETEENERSRFAQDLHDGIGPYLSATKFFLKTISKADDKEERDSLILKAESSMDEIIRNIKEISNNISPHILRNFGLLSALQSFKKRLQCDTTNISIISNASDKRFNENIEITCFRIFLELINNTLKYTKATQIIIKINSTDRDLMLDFAHNGEGFNIEDTLKEARGQGLFNIISRVNSLKGRYKFNTSEDESFQFTSWFPLN